MKRDKKELELEYIYNELFDKMVELVLRYNEPQIVASTMMSHALRSVSYTHLTLPTILRV